MLKKNMQLFNVEGVRDQLCVVAQLIHLLTFQTVTGLKMKRLAKRLDD